MAAASGRRVRHDPSLLVLLFGLNPLVNEEGDVAFVVNDKVGAAAGVLLERVSHGSREREEILSVETLNQRSRTRVVKRAGPPAGRPSAARFRTARICLSSRLNVLPNSITHLSLGFLVLHLLSFQFQMIKAGTI